MKVVSSSKKNNKQIRNIVKSMIAVTKQVKHTQYEFTVSATDTSTSPASFVLWPQQGIAAFGNEELESGSQGQRIGNTIFVKDLRFNYQVSLGVGTFGNDLENVVRVIIFQWIPDNNLESPIFGDIFIEAVGSYPYLAHYNPDTKRKYRVLYDRTHCLSNTAGNKFTEVVHAVLKPPIQKLVLDQDSTFGFGAILVSGSIWSIMISDSSITPNPVVDYSTVFYYTD
jgi:hypothetical protein